MHDLPQTERELVAVNALSDDAWGNVRYGNTTGRPRARYCANLGHVQDDESDLIYMRARYYEPTSGRFVSEDPAMDGGNWFSYCANCPVNRVDASGRNAILIGAIAATIAKTWTELCKDASDGNVSLLRIVLKTPTGIVQGYVTAQVLIAISTMFAEALAIAKLDGRGGALALVVAAYCSTILLLLDAAFLVGTEGLIDILAPASTEGWKWR